MLLLLLLLTAFGMFVVSRDRSETHRRHTSTNRTRAPRDATFLGREKEEKRVSLTWSLLKGGGGQFAAPSRARKLLAVSDEHTGRDVAAASAQDAMPTRSEGETGTLCVGY